MNDIWWNKITNASHFIEEIVDAVQDKKSVLLQLPINVPWYSTMQDLVSNDIYMLNSDRSYQYVSDTGIEPGEYLLREFCKSEKRAQYRPSIGYAEFLAKSDDIVLNDMILWVASVNGKQVQKWLDFIVNYNKALGKGKKGCLFIIETYEEKNISNKKGIKHISFEKEIEYYDYYLFNMLAASDLKGSQLFKQYLAEAVSTMLPNDVELSSRCILHGKAFLENPLEVIERIVDEEYRSDGTCFNVNVTKEQLQERLWEAQIKVIFPLIEKHRNAIVKKYHREISALLPITAAYGEVFHEVTEVELGTISYLQGTDRIQMCGSDAHKVSKLKKARNDLAHIKTIVQEDVEEIFSFELGR